MDPEGWLTSELASFGCAACGQPYGEGHVRLIAQREEIFFLDLACPHCGSQAVAIVTIQVDGETPGSTDPRAQTPGELPTAVDGSRSVVSVDDVIDAHALLRDFSGDVHQLIARFDGERP